MSVKSQVSNPASESDNEEKVKEEARTDGATMKLPAEMWQ